MIIERTEKAIEIYNELATQYNIDPKNNPKPGILLHSTC